MTEQKTQDNSETYSQSQVWQILTEGSDDIDEVFDMEIAIEHLPVKQRVFLVYINRGHTVLEAMERAGLTGNQTHVKRAAIKMLTDELNGVNAGEAIR